MPALTDTGLWIAFAVGAAAILLFDFVVLARSDSRLRPGQALLLVGCYAAVALAFGVLLLHSRGARAGMEYLTGYLIEQSLSFDNIFLWVLIFKTLSIPEEDQETVLFWGILGAIVLRACFIFGGIELLSLFDWLVYVFAAVVIVSGIRLLKSGPVNVENSRIMKFAKAHLPVTKEFRGRKFVVRRGGSWCGTPLLLAVVVIELSDLLFALDSIPAIFGVTRDTLIIYSSNIFAVMGLRALFFAIAGLVEDLPYLRYGLALLLVLIGIKMIAGNIVAIPVWMTLAATLAVVSIAVALSLALKKASAPASRSSRAAR
jgi:tellurite resistance protein TerC